MHAFCMFYLYVSLGTEQQGLYFWIKVRYDDGIIHVKAKERLKFIGETTVNEVVEYHTGKPLEELLPDFWIEVWTSAVMY